MPPLLPDEATKAQETFRLGDRFYVEEHGLVLGELLTSLKLYPFMYKGIVENRSYNDMIEAGFYKIENNMIDGPNTYWGTLVVFNDSAHITQVFYPNIDSAEISTRKGSINNFAKSAWRSISFT